MKIPLTNCHRGIEVQNVVLKGLKYIDEIFIPDKHKGFVLLTWFTAVFLVAIAGK